MLVMTDSTPLRLIDPEFHANGTPHEVWRWMRKNEPLYWHEPSEFPGFWSVTRYEDIQTVYGNPQVFSSAKGVLLRPLQDGDDPGGGITLALTDPPRHKQLRSIMAKWFTMPYARSLENKITIKLRELINNCREKKEFNFSHDIASKLTLFVTCYVLGIPEADHETIFHWTNEAFEAAKPLASYNQFMLYFGDFMENKIVEPKDDLASAIVHSMIDDTLLAEEEILFNFENLIGATENAGLSMASGVLAFLEHPQSWDALRKNRELLSSTLEEVLRWASSATHSMRTTTQNTTINGKKIESGDRIVLWLPSGNRDESIFTNPYQFNITRHPNRHLAHRNI